MSGKNRQNSITHLSRKWHLSSIRLLAKSPFTNNYVALANSTLYASEVVSKICNTNNQEQQALHYFNGKGCVHLLDYDPTYHALLLEHLTPGISLKKSFPLDDIKAVEITAEVIKKLHSKPLSETQFRDFNTVNEWLSLLDTFKSVIIPEHLLCRAQELSHQLLATQGNLYLLHGDLHHENILSHGKEWVAIDPMGVVGEREYEVGTFIRNPVPDLLQEKNAQEIIIRRIDQFSKIFNFDRQRLTDWSFVQAVLAACWAEQDKADTVDYFVKCAKTIKNL